MLHSYKRVAHVSDGAFVGLIDCHVMSVCVSCGFRACVRKVWTATASRAARTSGRDSTTRLYLAPLVSSCEATSRRTCWIEKAMEAVLNICVCDACGKSLGKLGKAWESFGKAVCRGGGRM